MIHRCNIETINDDAHITGKEISMPARIGIRIDKIDSYRENIEKSNSNYPTIIYLNGFSFFIDTPFDEFDKIMDGQAKIKFFN